MHKANRKNVTQLVSNPYPELEVIAATMIEGREKLKGLI
jgi:hypothetical protein